MFILQRRLSYNNNDMLKKRTMSKLWFKLDYFIGREHYNCRSYDMLRDCKILFQT